MNSALDSQPRSYWHNPCIECGHQARYPSNICTRCATRPPYWGLRDYGVDGQIGLEPTLDEWLSKMLAVFAEVHRILKRDGTLWVNMGDSYASAQTVGYKPKDLIGQPWRLALALQHAGWWLRQDIVWHKPNPMPETLSDRCTKAHEYLFLLSKAEKYYFDFDCFQEPVSGTAHARGSGVNPKAGWKSPDGWDTSTGNGSHGTIHRQGREKGKTPRAKQNNSFSAAVKDLVLTRNRRSVWTVPTEGFKGAHFATFPPKLIEPCILAGSRPGDLVLDPFMGSGTTAQVAQALGRQWIGCELNPEYGHMIEERTQQTALVMPPTKPLGDI